MRLEKTFGAFLILLSSAAAGFAERPFIFLGRRTRQSALITRPYRQTDDWTTIESPVPLIRIDQEKHTQDIQLFPRPELFNWNANQNGAAVAIAPAEFHSDNNNVVGLNMNMQSASIISSTKGFVQSFGSSVHKLCVVYSGLCERHPLVTKSLTAAVLAVLGSLLSQRIEAHKACQVVQTNWNHLKTFFLCGCLFQGPFCHFWYAQLWKVGRWMERRHGCSKNVQALTQVFINQTLGTIIFLPAYFFAYEYFEALVHWRAPLMSIAITKLQESVASVLLMQYYVWPLVNWFNFSFVPESLRDMFNNVISIFWNAYLCMFLV